MRTLSWGILALVFAFSVWARPGIADEPKASWTARLWPGSWASTKVPEGKKDGRGEPIKEGRATLDAAQRLRAELDWKRRAEVCQKLRQIAFETNNEELDRLAERLDQRAWDIYVKRIGGPSSGFGPSLDERILAERVGIDPDLLNPAPTKQPGHVDTKREAP
jgi:hypothetical protein